MALSSAGGEPGRPLDDHRIVVTGAGRGLGLAMARRIGQSGATVYIAELDGPRGEKAAEQLQGEGIRAHFVEMDVTDAESVADAAGKVLSEGPVDALVNNAALADGVGGKPFYEIEVDTWDRLMAVNSRGPWLVARSFAPAMIQHGSGRIVNIASDAALYGSARLAHYIASKGAVIAMTRAMARDLGPHGITVNAVAPGLTETESSLSIPEERHSLYRNNRAIERPQQPEDTVGIVAFLIGPEAAYITGQLIVVDGGFVFH